MHQPDTSDVEKMRRAVGRAGFVTAVAGLVAGVVLLVLGYDEVSARVFQIAFGVLLAMPVKNVLAVMADELLRRDWWFSLLAIGVLAELAFSVLDWLR